MKLQLTIKYDRPFYNVCIKRRVLWIFWYWEILLTDIRLEYCEKLYQEIIDGKHKELI